MKETILYTIAAISSIVIFGYTVHMFIGGLVSRELELTIIAITCVIAATVIGFMAWDVMRRRGNTSHDR